MFVEWGFLLVEIWVLLALAALIGLAAGWLIWGGRQDDVMPLDNIGRMRSVLDPPKPERATPVDDGFDDVPAMQGGGYLRPSKTVAPISAANPLSAPGQTSAPVANDPIPPVTPKPVTRVADLQPGVGQKPNGLKEPRDGLPDDLTKIKGIGAKLERVCNDLGFFHYDQIANWSADEIAWVDDNLEGFKGRVTRDNWVAQARAMGGGITPAFVRRTDQPRD